MGDLAKVENKQFIKIDGDLVVAKKDMIPHINSMGVKQLKYKYCIIKTSEGEYKIGDPKEYARIVKALNSPEVKFVKVKNNLINLNCIRIIKEKIGYMSLQTKGGNR